MTHTRIIFFCSLLAARVAGAQTSGDAPHVQEAPTEATPAPDPPDQLPDGTGWGVAAGLRYLEIIRGGGKPHEKLPLLIVIHGLGDKPDPGWLGAIDVEPGVKVRMILPQAPTPYGGGFSWFPYRSSTPDQAALTRGITAAAERLARTISVLQTARPTRGRAAVVTGFSQGGMLSYALALTHPELIAFAAPISGMLPEPMWPDKAQAGAHAPRLHALHGKADNVVRCAADEELVERLRAHAYAAELTCFEGVGHAITPEMSALVRAQISAALVQLKSNAQRKPARKLAEH